MKKSLDEDLHYPIVAQKSVMNDRDPADDYRVQNYVNEDDYDDYEAVDEEWEDVDDEK
jgi:hypothetical protein